MTLLDQLNPYARRFAERLFAVYPEWETLGSVSTWPTADLGSLWVEVSSPVHPDLKLSVNADRREITVGFGPPDGYHTHFVGWWEEIDGHPVAPEVEEDSFVHALREIAGILSEGTVLAVAVKADGKRSSTVRSVGDKLRVKASTRVDYQSWVGTHDRSDTGPANR